MGREIRMVPEHWEHPKDERGNDKPMHDETFEHAAAEWKAGYAEWEAGKRPEYCGEESAKEEFWEWHGAPPDREYYRPWKDQEATWFQLWQTVSEGSPVSPPFATREELAAYLAEFGDFWDQHRGAGGWGKEAADAFVASGWAPSMMMVGGKFIDAKDIPLAMQQQDSPPADSNAPSVDGLDGGVPPEAESL